MKHAFNPLAIALLLTVRYADWISRRARRGREQQRWYCNWNRSVHLHMKHTPKYLALALAVSLCGCALFTAGNARTAANVIADICPMLGIDPKICADADKARDAVDAVLAQKRADAVRLGAGAPRLCPEAK